jgi:hypothetical protein
VHLENNQSDKPAAKKPDHEAEARQYRDAR